MFSLPVRFVIGRSGSGKTHRCLDEMTAACAAQPLGPPIIYLVPEQASYQAEKALLEFGNIDGYTRAQVLSFTRLAEYVFARGGEEGLPRLTRHHRDLVAAMLVAKRRHGGEAALFQFPGVEEAVQAFLAEMRQYDADPARIREALDRLYKEPNQETKLLSSHLRQKLDALAGLVDEYRQVIADRFQDPEDTMAGLCRAIESEGILLAADIYVDGFNGFTPVEERVLGALARRAKRLTVSLLGDPGRTEKMLRGVTLRKSAIFLWVEETLERLLRLFREGDAEKPEFVYTRTSHRFQAEELSLLEERFLAREAATVSEHPAIALRTADNERDEARQAAEIAANWMAEHGWRPGEIAVMSRDLDIYAPFLEESFRNLRLPHFIDQSEPLDTHPFVTGIQSLVRAVLNPARVEHLMGLAKSGLLDLARRDVDLLENYVIQYPRTIAEWYGADPWPAPPARSPFDEEDVYTHEDVPLEVDQTRLHIAETVNNFRAAIGLPRRREGLLSDFLTVLCKAMDAIAEGREWPDEDRAILARIGELIGEALDVAGDQALPWEIAAELAVRSLASLALPRIPPMLDEVFIGQADRSRQPAVKGMVVLGLAEGRFPRIGGNATLINDAEREMLQSAGVDLRPSSRQQFERETLLAYRAFTAPSEALVVTRPRGGVDGTELSPSLYWSELERLFSEEKASGGGLYIPERAWRTRELAATALRQLDKTHENARSRGEKSRVVLAKLEAAPLRGELDSVFQSAAWRNKAQLEPEGVARFLNRKLSASSTQLDSFGRCPFQHFAQFFLRPRELKRPEFERRDAGQFCHAVLRNFTALMRENAGSSIDAARLYEEAKKTPAEALERTGFLSTSTGRHIAARLDIVMQELAGWIVEAAAFLRVAPQSEETPFHPRRKGAMPPIELGEPAPGWSFVIAGQIDRIDKSEGVPPFYLVIDYKLKRKKFDFVRWDGGENTQLPLYILALERQMPGSVAGGLYLEIVLPNNEEKRQFHGLFRSSVARQFLADGRWNQMPFLNGSSGDPDAKPRRSGTVIADGEFEAVLAETENQAMMAAARIIKGDAAVYPSRRGTSTPCGYCSFRALCGLDYRINAPNRKPPLQRIDVLERLRGDGP